MLSKFKFIAGFLFGIQLHAFATAGFEGILALSNCSASLVAFYGYKNADDALLLTNGHCLGRLLEPREVVINRAANYKVRVLSKTATEIGQLRGTKVLYGTMYKTDMALIQLDSTYDSIHQRFAIEPLMMRDRGPEIGTAIEIFSGYWKRKYSCRIEATNLTLKEARWDFVGSMRYSRPGCETIGGTSGSPVLDAMTREVIGVNNTGNESGELCTINNPCEVDANVARAATKGYAYAQQTYWIYSCLRSDGQLDLTRPGCLLPNIEN